MVGRLLQTQVEGSAALAWIQGANSGLECRLPPLSDLGRLFRTLQAAETPGRRLVTFLDLILTLAEAGNWHKVCRGFRGIAAGSGEQRVGFALRFLREHYCDEISQKNVAKRVGMAPSAFSRLFQRVTGQTFQSMLTGLRLEHSCRLLAGTSMSVAEVCFASGFRNLSNFNKQFSLANQISPRSYRNSFRQYSPDSRRGE